VPVVAGSTPVVAFGDPLNAWVATVELNPSRAEFPDRTGRELTGKSRRLETLQSLGVKTLAQVSPAVARKIVTGCNEYFRRNPYTWFKRLEIILGVLRASYFDGTACHLDLVQWATDPVWGKLPKSQQRILIEKDRPFLREQINYGQFKLLLLNGRSVVEQFESLLSCPLETLGKDFPLPGWTLSAGKDHSGVPVIGWNLNLQSTPGIFNFNISVLARAIKSLLKSRRFIG
jgi:hypothetical protein